MSDVIMQRLAEQADINKGILAKLEASRNESIELGKKLDEALKRSEAADRRVASRRVYLAELQKGGPDQGATIEERIERAVSEVEVEHLSHRGMRIPVIRSMPRGLAGIEDGRGLVFVRMVRAMALAQTLGRTTIEDVIDLARRNYGPNDPATVSLEEQRDLIKKADGDPDFMKRALGTQVVGNGASFVVPQFTATFQDYLFAASIMRQLGVQSLPLIGNGGEAILFFDTAMTVGYREEGAPQNESSPTEGSQNVLRRILSGTIAVNNEWLEEASYGIDAMLRTHIAQAMMAYADQRFLLGRGTENEIRGLDYWVEQPTTAHYANRTLDTGAVTVQTVMADFANAIGRITSVERKSLDPATGARPACAMLDRDARGLAILKEGTDPSRPFRDEIRGGSIFGLKLGRTTQLPSTLAGDASGSGTNNKSKIFVFDANACAIFERDGIQIEAFRGGAYKDSTGTMQSGVSNRQTVITADMHHDFAELWRGKATARIDSVDYGPAAGVTV